MPPRALLVAALLAIVAGCAGPPEDESTQTQPPDDATETGRNCPDALADDERATGDPIGDVIDTNETGEPDAEEAPC